MEFHSQSVDYKTINNQEELINLLNTNLSILLYFSKKSCNISGALEPKIRSLLETNYPKIPFYFIDMNKTPDIAREYSVFVEPTIIVVFDGKETIRKSRIFSVSELSDAIKRIYGMAF